MSRIPTVKSRSALLALVMIACASAPVQAQQLTARLGAGPAHAGAAGAAALLGAELSHGSALLRADARAVGTGRSADWDGSARTILLGGGAGVAAQRCGAARTYALAIIAAGLDAREGDNATAVGAAVGVQGAARVALFSELRYERWLQRGVRHFDLPQHAVTLMLGVALR